MLEQDQADWAETNTNMAAFCADTVKPSCISGNDRWMVRALARTRPKNYVKTNGGPGHVKLRKIWEIVISGGLNLIAKRRVDFANLSSFMKY